MTTLEKIKKIANENIEIDVNSITPQARLLQDLDVDSLTLVHLVTQIEEDFEIDISDEWLEKIKTVQDVIDCIEENL